MSLYYSAIGSTALTSIGLLLLVTPTGSLPSPRWRWLARVLVATPVLMVVVATLANGPLDPRHPALGGPFDLRGHGGLLLVANQVALAVTMLAVVVAAGSLVGRFRRARGVERLQLQWLALAALVVVMAGGVILAGLAFGVASASTLLSLAVGLCVAALPVATAAAVDRRFNRRRYDTVRTIAAFNDRRRQQVDLEALTGELLAVSRRQCSQPRRRCGCGRRRRPRYSR